MGNRSYLYLAAQGREGEEFEEVAEANNILPVLWKFLLARGAAAQPIEHQRVIGNAGTAGISAEASAALARLKTLAEFVGADPRTAKVPGVALYFTSAMQFLQERVDVWAAQAEGPVVFSANLDELSWMSSDDPQAYISQCVAEFDDSWRALEQAAQARDFSALDALLEFDESHAQHGDWSTWSITFGFAGLNDRYFSHSEDAPRALAYADYDPDDDEAGDTYLGDDCKRFKQGGLWGVQWNPHLDDTAPQQRLAPQWDRVLRLGSGWDDGDPELVAIKRDGLLGLAAYSGERAGEVLLAPCLDAIWPFQKEAAVARQGEKFGFLRRDGRWLVPPTWSDASDFEHGHAMVAQGDKQGLICADGSVALPLEYDSVEWDADFSGWVLVRAGAVGLLHADGRPWITPQWSDLSVARRERLIYAARGELWGALDWQGQPVLPCDYSELQMRFADDDNEDSTEPLQLIAQVGENHGLIDHTGRTLVPLAYAALQNMERGSEHLIAVRAHGPGDRTGVWHIGEQRLVLPCQYQTVWLLALGDEQAFFVVQGDALGVLRSDGRVRIPAEYAWIGHENLLKSQRIRRDASALVGQAWARGDAAPAELAGSGLIVWVKADGTRQPHTEHLAQKYARGDIASAQELAEHYRDTESDTESADKNMAQARLWMGRAAGAEALPAGKQHGLLEAMIQYAWMLDNGLGGERDASAARHWLEQAQQHGGQRDLRVMRHLGSLLWSDGTGPEDAKRAVALFTAGAKRNDCYSTYNLGLAHHDGVGVPQNKPRALELFVKSEEQGFPDGALQAGLLCVELAKGLGTEGADAQARAANMALARLHLRQAVGDCEGAVQAQACAALAALLFTGEGGEEDVQEAVQLWEQGAASGDLACIRALAQDIYGNRHSPLYNAAQAATWQAQLPSPETGRPLWARLLRWLLK